MKSRISAVLARLGLLFGLLALAIIVSILASGIGSDDVSSNSNPGIAIDADTNTATVNELILLKSG